MNTEFVSDKALSKMNKPELVRLIRMKEVSLDDAESYQSDLVNECESLKEKVRIASQNYQALMKSKQDQRSDFEATRNRVKSICETAIVGLCGEGVSVIPEWDENGRPLPPKESCPHARIYRLIIGEVNNDPPF